ncbi:hypothetical protein CsSME_00034680 [Camellia sinensis var. sinensis]
MDKCSGRQSYLTVDKNGKVSLRSFWVSNSSGKCLTVFGGKKEKRTVGVADCKFDGSNPYQLFAFRFHYHKAFCCCGLHNN